MRLTSLSQGYNGDLEGFQLIHDMQSTDEKSDQLPKAPCLPSYLIHVLYDL